ncbi:regulatory protein [Streptomyces bingchenggensis BCW-1]|uniref:Regulatory protein n=1 Tax=Streptomyces bingchenggensis (strain BCW-1) TaxID=749414 RepID=D7C740_STRBB|nr:MULTISPECIES: DUF397 domain-containing protein [Streptomyces]ADI08427.1 regulatory protein [Streptomyces bingchenggensis BCW-1]
MSTTPDLTGALWVKSSFSGNGGAQCVEWAPNIAASGLVPVRDSKVPDGPALIFEAAAWASFVTFAKTRDI